MNKKQPAKKAKRDYKSAFKKITQKAKDGIKFVAAKLWGARAYIGAVFTGMFMLFAKGFFSGYSKRVDEEGEAFDKRMETLDKLAGQDTEDVDAIEEARDLVDEYGIDTLRQAACAIEDGIIDEEEST